MSRTIHRSEPAFSILFDIPESNPQALHAFLREQAMPFTIVNTPSKKEWKLVDKKGVIFFQATDIYEMKTILMAMALGRLS